MQILSVDHYSYILLVFSSSSDEDVEFGEGD